MGMRRGLEIPGYENNVHAMWTGFESAFIRTILRLIEAEVGIFPPTCPHLEDIGLVAGEFYSSAALRQTLRRFDPRQHKQHAIPFAITDDM